jgi:site-specific recombinase XerD
MERAGLDGWSFHDLRHFFVSELFRMGVSAEAIRIMAGHADLGTTQRYADLDANDLRAAIERIDGNAPVTGKSEGAPEG